MKNAFEVLLQILAPIMLITIIGILIALHYGIITDLRSEYDEKLSALEREKDDAINERDLYFNYLVATPESLVQLQTEIDSQKQKNLDLEQKLASVVHEQTIESYSSEGYVRKGSTYRDEQTNLVVGLLDVYRNDSDVSQAKINVSLPTGEQSQIDVIAGDSYNFSVDNKNYWFVVTEANWYGDSIDISINERTPESMKAVLVKKRYLFTTED